MIKFPDNFFWGAATSAYQVEGNNAGSDWWEWEKKAGLKECSGEACRSYQLYKEDFDLAKSLNHNCHRLSIEWARIEPEEGSFSQAEIAHYQEVILALRERNIEPIVTLHHFTNPIWFSKLGGWENKSAQAYFTRYVGKIVEALCPYVRFWVTINEPMVYAYQSYLLGVWPPQEKSLLKTMKVTNNLAKAHIRAYKLIHAIYKKRNLASPLVSIAKNAQAFDACCNNFRNRFAVWLRNSFYNFYFVDMILRDKALDFIGINYYTRSRVEVERFRVKNIILDVCKNNHGNLKKNTLGWEIYPQGLYNMLLSFKKYNLPIFILENGICTEDDALRWDFIRSHLEKMSLAMDKGVKLLGYIHWSLIDNYEWDKGFSPRFGLISVDYNTYKRSIRESAKKFAEVCKTGKLND